MAAMKHLDKETLAETWLLFKEERGRYLESKDPIDLVCRNELAIHYQPLVDFVANRIGSGLPSHVDWEDLRSYGSFGLLDALNKFDFEKGVKFETYASNRIRGAILDEIRAQDWVPRSVRSKARDIIRAREECEAILGRPASHEEVAQSMGLPMSEYWNLTRQGLAMQVSGYASHEWSASFRPDSQFEERSSSEPFVIDRAGGSSPEEMLQVEEVTDLMGEAVNQMDERSKILLALYYLQEMTLAEIGQILGVTESRVCQLQSKALQSLQEVLGHGGLTAA